jgi:aryl-alcohol dehydrogenase-like predicted oxidoreductase
MVDYAITNRLTPFISMQNQYNAMYREEEREMMPMLKHFGVGTVPWGPVAAGLLCRPFKDSGATPRGAAKATGVEDVNERPGDKAIIDKVEETAGKKGVSMAEVAIAWMTHDNEYVSAPIVGIRSTERLDELISGMHLRLTKEERDEINGLYKPVPVRGHS